MRDSTERLLQLEKVIIKEFSSHWALNDSGHRQEHFADVNKVANHINTKLNLGYSPTLIMLAAYFHDLFAWSRVNHHVLSHQYVMSNDHFIFEVLATPEEREMVAVACLNHRASYKGTFSVGMDELINSADRGVPNVDLNDMLYRSFLVTVGGYNPDPKIDDDFIAEIAPDIVKHLKEKFGSAGYARYPGMYRAVFDAEIQSQQVAVDALTIDEAEAILRFVIIQATLGR